MNLVYTPSVNFRVRTIGSNTILFGEGVSYSLNECANFIWDNLDGMTSVEEIVELMLENYNCSKEEATEGVNDFLEFLRENKAIKIS